MKQYCIGVSLAVLAFAGCQTTNPDPPEPTGPQSTLPPELSRPDMLDKLRPIAFLDALVAAAPKRQHYESFFIEVDVRENYVREEDVPAVLERLDSERPAYHVKKMGSIIWTSASLSTEGREAAYLFKGFTSGRFPPTENSEHFEYDPAYIRSWWSLRQKKLLTCDQPNPGELTLTAEEQEAAKLDIAESLYLRMFPGSYEEMQPIWIDYEGKDPPEDLMKRFALHRPKVNPVSKLNDIMIVDDGKEDDLYPRQIPGTLYSVYDMKLISNDFATARTSSYSGVLNAAGHVTCLRKEQGKWIVVGIKDMWLS